MVTSKGTGPSLPGRVHGPRNPQCGPRCLLLYAPLPQKPLWSIYCFTSWSKYRFFYVPVTALGPGEALVHRTQAWGETGKQQGPCCQRRGGHRYDRAAKVTRSSFSLRRAGAGGCQGPASSCLCAGGHRLPQGPAGRQTASLEGQNWRA